MSDFDPFDPVNMAMRSLHSHNLLAAKDAEVARLKAEVERLEPELEQRCRELNLSLAQQAIQLRQIGELKAEVELLSAADSYLQDANEHAFEKRCDELEAEVERLKEGNDCLGQMHDKEMERSAYLCEEVNRTTAWGRGLESDLSHARVEISFLKAEVERLRASSFVTAVPVEHYDRVVKAGDDMAFHYQELVRIEWGQMTTHIPPSVIRWNAAKEGKPSV